MALQTPHPIDLLLDAAGAGHGARLLELGGEQGCVAARAAARHVFSSCLIADRGSLNSARSQYPGVEFVIGALEDIPYPSDVFDSVVCHYRMPYFADPDIGMSEAFRILDADGVFAFTAITVRSNAPFVSALDHVLAQRGFGASPWRGSPHVITDPYRCARALSGAGFVRVEIRNVPITWVVEAGQHPADSLAAALLPVGRVKAVVHQDGAPCDAELGKACEAYRTVDGAIRLPMVAIVASGRKEYRNPASRRVRRAGVYRLT